MLIMLKKYFVVILPLLLLVMVNLTSCTVFDPPVVVPCYGHIDSISYHYDTLNHPESSRFAYITDAWVYLDDNPIGPFGLAIRLGVVDRTH